MEEKLEGLLKLLAAQTGVTVTQPDTPSTSTKSASTPETPESIHDQINLPLFNNETNDAVFPTSFHTENSTLR